MTEEDFYYRDGNFHSSKDDSIRIPGSKCLKCGSEDIKLYKIGLELVEDALIQDIYNLKCNKCLKDTKVFMAMTMDGCFRGLCEHHLKKIVDTLN